MSAPLPDLLTSGACGAASDVLGYDDTVVVSVPTTESGARGPDSAYSYSGDADVQDAPPESSRGASGGSPSGDASRAYNAVVFLPGTAAAACPKGALVRWTEDRNGGSPNVTGTVEGVRRSDGALLVRFP